MANEKVLSTKGNIVYIDDDTRPLLELDRKIRFITTYEFDIKDYGSFYGFLCGIISEDYDVDTIFIDGLSNIVRGNLKDAAHLFCELENLAHEKGVEFYINVNDEEHCIPEFLLKYVA